MGNTSQTIDILFEALSKTAATDLSGGQSLAADRIETAGVRGVSTDDSGRPQSHQQESAATGSIDSDLDELLAQALAELPVTEVEFTDELVKHNLDEILLLLIALHDGSHGNELLSDLSQHFETTLSPGTVYPALHDLQEAGYLSMHAKVRTKEYSTADEVAVRTTLEQTMLEHLAFGLLLAVFLARY
ncbi:PadR family transcription regulator [Natrialba magadii ATCC 43099]|uniref:PadR family transcription regulator n=1 Tax=Natrialba magadii (strain ATCC 43099 / DSM 3394 / CCM 3739 / CIP 104546 / IAM 13178 / JCM 8861 / NBRC 102185 / NCIMB 2190 / MS3) TaxID=547559 RepID=D3SSV3_NATMM|nr:PadR family transcriptional regulator [Natrialba magadii]ADD04899.1 PadR family transcription regulator [Natrialba magadii ATCC 43099]ELY23948.1 PadR family transcriptional regulator [Natrialba magadii ATCC 43099]